MLKKFKTKLLQNIAAPLLSLGVAHSALSLELAQSPLFLAQPVKPLVMLNMSNDHQLYFKAYDDYTDLDEDGIADTTYMNDYDYYGYFDSNKCYSYESGRFEPEAFTTNHFCDSVDGEWSGNFLNWATMTRMDAVRKILYGGLRSTDGDKDGITVLERAFLPQDAHAFAKYYNGPNISKLTGHNFPAGTSKDSGITLCNATDSATYDNSTNVFSQTNNRAPKIMVMKGNYSLWASNERWQCRWGSGSNGNNSSDSQINAYSSAPSKTDGFEYNARVQVCKAGLLEESCRSYPDGNSKPSGLLQKHGQNGEILFGLMTGSYGKNKSGGVLRKNIADLSDEIDADADGRFISSAGIVSTLNKLRIYGYRYSGGGNNGAYNDDVADDCPWALNSFSDGRCSNWGNPQSEIYLESLRYLAGKSVNTDFDPSGADDTSYISGLSSATWVDPIGSANHCAALNIIQFNASSSSYDDDFSDASDLNAIGTIDSWTNEIGTAEGVNGNHYFVGESGGDTNQLCTAKSVANLSDVAGTCPDAPRLGGTYDIAGLAYYARSSKIRTDYDVGNVTTYGVALAPAVPQVTIPVSGDGKSVTILPACRNNKVSGNCAIVDFKIIEQTTDGTSGTLYVNWEDSEQGGDFDQDMWGLIKYQATATEVKVTTQVMAQSTGDAMGFGYVISGTTRDGFHAHSGINGFTYTPENILDKACGVSGGCNCRVGDGYGGQGACNFSHSDALASVETYSVGDSSGTLLESPLYYAAKWGGFGDDENGQAPTVESISATDPETYYFAIDPAELEESLSKALDQVASAAGAASSVATNSTRLGTDTVVYQAMFDSADWSGQLTARQLTENGTLGSTIWQTDDNKFASHASRNIGTSANGSGVDFLWANLSDVQKAALIGSDTEADGMNRLDWVRGDDVDGLRDRESILGDVVNSNPVFAGKEKYRFDNLPADLGGGSYLTFYNAYKTNRAEVLYVNANDGMLHGFNAANGNELFAYVPSTIYDKLKNLTAPNYGTGSNPHTYNVDGPIFVGDAYIGNSWKTILIGTLGAGGKGLFVLDVTDPANFDPEDDVLFELTEADFPELGNITGQPVIAPTLDGWKVILGNGYNSGGVDSERARLFVIDLENPTTETRVIQAGTSGSNGLAAPSLLTNGNGLVVTAYAGDLLGNMWKFDLSDSTDPDNWGVAFQSGGVDVPLFTATDGTNRQPITAAPTLGLNEQMNNAIMVYFGTGSYLSSSDNEVGSVVNSFYAIADQGAAVSGRSVLMEKDISSESNTRTISNNDTTSWWATQKGWYLDLSVDGSVTGERVISKPLLRYDRLLFPTLITSTDPCAFGGSGWQMELKAVGDKFPNHSIFGEDGEKVDYAIIGYSDMVQHGEKAYLPTNNIKGELEVHEGSIPGDAVGRMSWRQLR
ncbi:PilC/PilY family type IV pilus protein [uncultured Microbulbifer sp.]|uniref:pilus assembly protein n=1 Tax=uncultured Microbulbifer sp. TaxID=348147 RepID=UPI00261A6B30|nr:PilC/PilY family type IV pilus protein [uncultured Microbulbifer sp.]